MKAKLLHAHLNQNRLISIQVQNPGATYSKLAQLYYGVARPRGEHVAGICKMIEGIEHREPKPMDDPEFIRPKKYRRTMEISDAYMTMDKYLEALKEFIAPKSSTAKILDEDDWHRIKLEIRRVKAWMKHNSELFEIEINTVQEA